MENLEKIKNIKELLREKGYKATTARVAIISAFSAKCGPLNAEDIYKKTRKAETDLVTIYRTLTAFEKSGILKKVDLRKDSVYFELAEDHHHHIVCTKCGLVEEFENCDINSLAQKIIVNSSNFKKIKQHSFELFGLCRSCI